jgi:hypothetical protein
LFKYKNRTKEYRVEVTIKSDNVKNLEIKNHEDFYSNIRENIVKIDSENFKSSFVKISLEPTECMFLELSVINPQQNFSLSTDIDYQITIVK